MKRNLACDRATLDANFKNTYVINFENPGKVFTKFTYRLEAACDLAKKQKQKLLKHGKGCYIVFKAISAGQNLKRELKESVLTYNSLQKYLVAI